MIEIIIVAVISILVTFVVTSAGWIRYHKPIVAELISEKHAMASESFSHGWTDGTDWVFGLTNEEFVRQRIIHEEKKSAK